MKTIEDCLTDFVELYAALHPIRTADCHKIGCQCLRCVYDCAKSYLDKEKAIEHFRNQSVSQKEC